MTNERRSDVRIHLHAIDPPFGPEHDIEFGLQDKRGEVDPVPATSTSTFEFQIEVVQTDHYKGSASVGDDHAAGTELGVDRAQAFLGIDGSRRA